MLDGDGANVSIGIKVEERIFVEIASLRNGSFSKLDQERVGTGKVANFRG